jgi:hypothetical protein
MNMRDYPTLHLEDSPLSVDTASAESLTIPSYDVCKASILFCFVAV